MKVQVFDNWFSHSEVMLEGAGVGWWRGAFLCWTRLTEFTELTRERRVLEDEELLG